MPSKVRDIAKFVGQTENSNRTNFRLKTSEEAGGLEVYDSLDLLPTSGLSAGDQALVSSNNRLYVSNGSGWYNVALVNATPTLSVSPSGTIALTPGSATNITVTATDSDNSNATLSLSVESGGDFFKHATLSQDSSVYTITPRSQESATALGFDGSSTLTFRATDGISQATVQNTFTLSFATTIEYLVVAGGGGGGGGQGSAGNTGGGGGGGGGGVVYNSAYDIVAGQNYAVAIGSGGSKGQHKDGWPGSGTGIGGVGGNSTFGSSIAYGGGGGGYPGGATPGGGRSKDGGNSGGSSGYPASGPGSHTQPDSDGYGGIGYGFDGATISSIENVVVAGGGGGGGAGGTPARSSSSAGGAGGAGLNSTITGSTVMYGYGGGGGHGNSGNSGANGAGNGGNIVGPANSGGGGSGQGKGRTQGAFSGGSGIVIIVTDTGDEPTIANTLTYSTDTSSRSGKSIISFTAGSGNISW